jgi:hypothetical protein
MDKDIANPLASRANRNRVFSLADYHTERTYVVVHPRLVPSFLPSICYRGGNSKGLPLSALPAIQEAIQEAI